MLTFFRFHWQLGFGILPFVVGQNLMLKIHDRGADMIKKNVLSRYWVWCSWQDFTVIRGVSIDLIEGSKITDKTSSQECWKKMVVLHEVIMCQDLTNPRSLGWEQVRAVFPRSDDPIKTIGSQIMKLLQLNTKEARDGYRLYAIRCWYPRMRVNTHSGGMHNVSLSHCSCLSSRHSYLWLTTALDVTIYTDHCWNHFNTNTTLRPSFIKLMT